MKSLYWTEGECPKSYFGGFVIEPAANGFSLYQRGEFVMSSDSAQELKQEACRIVFAPGDGDDNEVSSGYEDLRRILLSAFDQSARGKGKERHANDKPFNEQPIMQIARMVGLGGHAYQVCKKAQEACGMHQRDQHEAAIAEFKGVIVYAAAAILLIEESMSRK